MSITIDGSYGEGGGQIIRTAVSLAAHTGQDIEVVNVRAKRQKPGLQRQHLTAVLAAGLLCDAEIRGAHVGSTQFTFRPRARPPKTVYHFDIGTAGAAPLVAQTLLIPLTQASEPVRVSITGGTHVPHAPVTEYLQAVYLPALRRMGLGARLTAPAAGFYPRGGGALLLDIEAGPLPAPVNLTDRGKLRSLRAFVVTSNLPEHVAERGEAAVRRFMKSVGREVLVEARNMPSPGQGAAVVLAAECEGGLAGFTGLGERGKPMEEVARQPCEEFMAWWKSGAACDEHLADQLVLPAALARGESRWTTPAVTEHVRTVLWLVAQMLPIEWSMEPREAGSIEIIVRGSP